MEGAGKGWTLATHREYMEARLELVEMRRQADRELYELKIAHAREVAALEKERNGIYFAQLSKTVTLESFVPFKEYVTDYISSEKGQTAGISSTMTWVIAVAGAIVGAVTALLARGGL